ncbi:hypothetical protein [Aeromonas hydrophila]|uniref:hypothetical protein n=1 Tax=Aeromonas hydrophila TaxID=644 RepID=UPI000B0640DE|nr:hypothetical protein [Aeromonas hydrophila]QPR88249.1 hypothetical protein I6G73_01055 [Aeromonas hydrophila]UON53359.1 hypothetical protein IUJ49_00210 [Aeromonas hydrophila]
MSEHGKQVDKLVGQYSFLADVAFIEINNAISVSEDQNNTLKSNNKFIDRAINLLFGTQDKKQYQINKEHITAIEKLTELDERRVKQLIQTQHGLKKTISALLEFKKEVGSWTDSFELSLNSLGCRVTMLEQKIDIRDRIKTIINNWQSQDDQLPAYFSLVMLLTQLKWDSIGNDAIGDSVFMAWVKSEVLAAFKHKFGCTPDQLVPIYHEIELAKMYEANCPIMLDAINLALGCVENQIYKFTSRMLLSDTKESEFDVMPVMSVSRLTSSLLEGRLL